MTQKKTFKQCKVICFNEKRIADIKGRLPAERTLMEAAQRHKVLGHPVRQAILHALSMDECCVCDLAEILEKPLSTVSQHLRLLASLGFLNYRQEGKLVFYSLARDADSHAEAWKPLKEVPR